MNSNPITQARQLGQSIWYDDLSRELLYSGRLGRMVEADGLTGVTSNPAIFEKAISGSERYDSAIAVLSERLNADPVAIYEHLAIEDVRGAADILSQVYHRSAGVDGFVSLEVSPALADDAEATVREAKRLAAAVERANLMIKVPATGEGIVALERLIGEGVNVNATLIFSVDTYRKVAEAYMRGLEHYHSTGRHLSHPAGVASFFISRIDTAVDAELNRKIDETASMGVRKILSDLLGRAAIANAKLAYQEYLALCRAPRWLSLQAFGARPQRLLWASTAVKNPAYPALRYVEGLIGPDTVDTVPAQTYDEYLRNGWARPSLTDNIGEARRVVEKLAEVGVSMEHVAERLLRDGVNLFADAQRRLLAAIERKCARADASGDAGWHFEQCRQQ